MYIVFEGPECSGKTTLTKQLSTHLTTEGYGTYLTREPGSYDNDIAIGIRALLLNAQESSQIDVTTQALLFAASYHDNLKRYVIPALEDGQIVISDRSNVSSLAYQRTSPHVRYLTDITSKLIQPDIIFMLLPDYDTVQERLKGRGIDNYKDNVTREEHDAQLEVFRHYVDSNNNALNNTVFKILDYRRSLPLLLEEVIDAVEMRI